MWGCVVEMMQEPWKANLQELEPPTCGGEKRTFRKRLPKEAGATEQSETAGSETAGVTARSTKRSAGTEAVKADGEGERREDAEG